MSEQTVVDPEQTGEQEQAEGSEETAEKRGRGSATTKYAGKDFEWEALDELPETMPVGRSRVYFDLLTMVAEDQENLGKWHPIAKFATATGGKNVATTMTKQVEGRLTEKEKAQGAEKDIPEYEGWKWEFDARRVAVDPADPRSADPTARDSVLYCRIVQVAATEGDVPVEGQEQAEEQKAS